MQVVTKEVESSKPSIFREEVAYDEATFENMVLHKEMNETWKLVRPTKGKSIVI